MVAGNDREARKENGVGVERNATDTRSRQGDQITQQSKQCQGEAGHEQKLSRTVTDRKSLLALRGVGRESEAESVRFHGRRVTKVGPEVKHGPPEGWTAE